MRRLAVLCGLLLFAPVADATILTAQVGTLATYTGTTTGTSADSVMADGTHAICFLAKLTSTGTVAIEQSIDNGTTWTAITGGSATATGTICLADPLGLYRSNVTANGSGVTVKWRFAGKGG